ncbi:uncharacterized protein At1g10890-like [Humulus lupulus]|uniref:uncharacterized protein At1g10890-like n=1 Tax=Humulus lupulus TaxID=3486 RepID=UPI002B416965|nr:uncharacterized protein At1g10890-like [Humulus lupulus]
MSLRRSARNVTPEMNEAPPVCRRGRRPNANRNAPPPPVDNTTEVARLRRQKRRHSDNKKSDNDKRARTDNGGNRLGYVEYLQCAKCQKKHSGECRANTKGCYNCGQEGHRKKDCPQLKTEGKKDDKMVPPRVFALTQGEADASNKVVTAQILISVEFNKHGSGDGESENGVVDLTSQVHLMEKEDAERSERERKEFEEREKAWLEAMDMKRKKMEEEEEEYEEQRKKALDEESQKQHMGCEFVNLTRWKVAICGEYMKSRFKAKIKVLKW